jgi:glycosyltransferase involved in cell wall biosynthesis
MTAIFSDAGICPMRPEIDVLMATWNGSRFIEQQLESLFHQSSQNFRLIVRDDASTDSTLQIIERFRARRPESVLVNRNSTRQGACRTFSLLAAESDAPYFAFCDQDDVWLSDKLERELTAAKQIEAECGDHTPVMVFSDMELIGPDNRRQSASMWKMKHMNPHRATLGALLVQNLVTGCTVLGNHSLLLKGLPIPEEALMHDFWLGLVAAAFGRLVPLDKVTVRYRQHENNANGAGKGFRIGDAFRRVVQDPVFAQGIARSRSQSRKFTERYASQLSPQQKEVLQAWSRSKDLPVGVRQWTLYRNGLRRTRFLNNLAFLARV